MKKLLLTSALLAVCAGAFAQGKVNLINDGASLITLTTVSGQAAAADQSLLGQAVGNLTPLPSGQILMAGLYGGTSQGSLFLYSTFTMNLSSPGSAGVIGPLHIVLSANAATGAPLINGIPAGTAIGAGTPWFQIRVWNSTFASYEAAAAAGTSYLGQGAAFQMNPGSSIAYINTSPSANSTWTDSPIVVAMVPEPSTFALAGLGAAAMLIIRRRK
jgi:hypothetical protein